MNARNFKSAEPVIEKTPVNTDNSEFPLVAIGASEGGPESLEQFPAIIPGDSGIDKIVILLREQSGHDFSLYKKNTLLRRIERRKGIHQIDKMSNYIRLLQENPREVEILFNSI